MKKMLIGLTVVLVLVIVAWLLWNLVVALVSGLVAFIVFRLQNNTSARWTFSSPAVVCVV
jgi:uncharacterized protein YxeA